MGKKSAAKRNAERERQAKKAAARKALGYVLAAGVAEAVVSLLGDVLVVNLAGSAVATMAAMIVLAASIVLLVISVILMVRAYKAVMECREIDPDLSEKILLGAALWFGGALPMDLVSIVQNLITGGDGLVSALVSTGLGVVLTFLAYGSYRKDLV